MARRLKLEHPIVVGVVVLVAAGALIPGELRKVRIVYRCELCGAEVRMTVAPTEDPDPPRHCQDEMVLVTPLE